MPMIILLTPTILPQETRVRLAMTLTETAAGLAHVGFEKVQVFFRQAETDLESLEIHAVAPESTSAFGESNRWRDAFQEAIGDVEAIEIDVYLYPADHTAKGGKLRANSDKPEGRN
jgi:hypothetical protein